MAEPPVLIVSVSGVRGLVGNGLTAGVAARFAAAFGSTVAGQTVVLSRDDLRATGVLYGSHVAVLHASARVAAPPPPHPPAWRPLRQRTPERRW